MKKNYVVCILALVSCLSLWVKDSWAVAVTMTAEAEITAAVLAGTEDQSLNFGSIVTTGATSVTIDASGMVVTGGVLPSPVLPSAPAGTSVSGGHNGRIDVTTTVGANISIVYPTSITITETGGATMTINDIAINSTASPLAATAAGPNKIFVGGVLGVSSGQTPGTYDNAAVTITINYQ
ncbi:DUF4402 domain-containing protein [Desulfobotulus sp. H1]|uniref:DUF4402 domain-containing protein n=1 Tax=Desulfobotulus pelophilus TaxID=2823377 RepID=A0ABT3N8X1_9BACT|nr:DUF4402 domain-containing protein [Desulfobotulus pelophilus]MCW7753903.1 DUF4402 domain-containing protein [Desulfobotulus pelophilus]